KQRRNKCTITQPSLQVLIIRVVNGWSEPRQECLREYWTYRDELTIQDGIIYKRHENDNSEVREATHDC
ncbi:hypothetical protein LSH36_1186g01025, partial [Paralvinella palmiformis]